MAPCAHPGMKRLFLPKCKKRPHYDRILVGLYSAKTTGFIRSTADDYVAQTSDRRITQHVHGVRPDKARWRQRG